MEWTLEQIKENRRRWIAALRSGEYRQCSGILHFEGKHCCLGVGELLVYGPDYDSGGNYYHLDEAFGLIGNQRELGLNQLVSMNDMQRKSFAEIADHIERNMQDNRDGLFAEGTV
jgi:hypothetical protein